MKKVVTYNGLHIPTLLTGTYQCKGFARLTKIVKTCIQFGIFGFDTAPSYGTERLLGKVLRKSIKDFKIDREDLFISTKIDSWQMQDSDGKVEFYVDNVLKKMNLDYLDQLLIHWPIPEYFEKTWKNFINIYKSGKAKLIGVSNVRIRHLQRIMGDELIPMVIQNERHPLWIDEKTLDFCKKNEIVYEAYSPVGQMKQQIRNADILHKLASKYDKTIGQIIMRWHLDSGSIPVFKTTKPERIKEYSDIFDFSLAEADIHAISSLNKNHKIFLESIGCPGF